MNSKKFSEAMSELDSKYVDEAINYKKKSKKPIWIKWGAIAACLCLVVAGIAVSQIPNVFPDHGAGIDPGGTHPDGADPIIASVAVYPATEKIEDVADATNESISEADAYELTFWANTYQLPCRTGIILEKQIFMKPQ